MAHNHPKLPVQCDAEECRAEAVWLFGMSGYPGDYRLACNDPEHVAQFKTKAWTIERIVGPSAEDKEAGLRSAQLT